MSSAKEIIFEEEARNKLKQGIQKLADVVGPTIGPKGRNVGVDAPFGAPKITNDGNSVVKEVEEKDQYLNMGISMGKQVAEKMKDRCGDGTTTGILLLSGLVTEGVKYVATGASPILLKRGMEKGLKCMLEAIEKSAIEVSEEIENIATISASNDREIGKTIANALNLAGKSGVVTIEEGKKAETTIESVEGMQFDRGTISRYFFNDLEKMQLVMENPAILITDKKIGSIQEILPLLQSFASTGRELLIIAEDVEADALSTLVINRIRGSLKVAAVKAPGFGDQRKALLGDIATLTGATVVSEETGMVLTKATSEVLGSATKITIDSDTTTVVGGAGKRDSIEGRIAQIDNEIKGSSGYEKEKLESRKAKLAGGVAQILVGAPTEVEMKTKKQKFDDALSATKAAMEEGIVPGGGVMLMRAASAIKELDLSPEEMMGAHILQLAADTPFRRIVENCGRDSSLIKDEVITQEAHFGYNVAKDQVEDLLKAGVIDPAKVVKNALSYAVSIAGMVLISEALIGEAPDDEERAS